MNRTRRISTPGFIMLTVVTALEKLRKRRKPIARVLVPVVSWVWLSAAASPCLGMVTGAGAEPHDTHHTEDVPAAHDAHQPPIGHAGHCPHCPPAPAGENEEPAASHISCEATDGPSAPTQKWQPNYAALAGILSAPGPFVPDLSTPAIPAGARTVASGRSLNLRYCVFLN